MCRLRTTKTRDKVQRMHLQLEVWLIDLGRRVSHTFSTSTTQARIRQATDILQTSNSGRYHSIVGLRYPLSWLHCNLSDFAALA